MSYSNGLSGDNNSNNENGRHGSSEANASIPSSSSSTYQNVIHKKQEGTLILNESAYTFYPIKPVGSSNGNGSSNNNSTTSGPMKQPWLQVVKHQVSPATHARHLLKLILQPQTMGSPLSSAATSISSSPSKSRSKSSTAMFEFKTRDDVERIRKDITNRLMNTRKIQALNANNANNNANNHVNMNINSRKRNHDEIMNSNSGTHNNNNDPNTSSTSYLSASPSSSTYTQFTKTQSKVASASLLASYPTLRNQHKLLLQSNANNPNTNDKTSMLSNDEQFWSTAHSTQRSNQFSKIIGVTSRGLSSTIKSSLDIQITTHASSSSSSSTKKKDSKKESSSSSSGSQLHSGNNNAITLGVEEMKQIFIMYPAVHAIYEEKVPLELSEELFWRKYLESEYFHRDRGKLGMSARTHLLESSSGLNHPSGGGDKKNAEDDDDDDKKDDKEDDDDDKKDDKDDKNGGSDKKEDQNAVDKSVRVATASSNDIFQGRNWNYSNCVKLRKNESRCNYNSSNRIMKDFIQNPFLILRMMEDIIISQTKLLQLYNSI